MVGALIALSSGPAEAKTAKECGEEYTANKNAIKASGQTKKDYCCRMQGWTRGDFGRRARQCRSVARACYSRRANGRQDRQRMQRGIFREQGRNQSERGKESRFHCGLSRGDGDDTGRRRSRDAGADSRPGSRRRRAGASPLGPRSGADCGKAQADGCPYRH
jgi:hypothetical protein